MNKYVLAVSGGVDSVVLLDMMTKMKGVQLIVAHFDHGIRKESAEDAEFVKNLSEKYGLPFETRREELGAGASEELARTRRYEFLRSVAKKYNATLTTAHHMDDVVESIAINIIRGTGWRGLAVMDADDIDRPLVMMAKKEIIDYANKNNLDWREDVTNQSEEYLRNRIRKKASQLNKDTKMQLMALWVSQKDIRRKIDIETAQIMKEVGYNRHFFINQDKTPALELIRCTTQARLTRPQMIKALHAIKTAMPGKKIEAGGGVRLVFTTRNFKVEMVK